MNPPSFDHTTEMLAQSSGPSGAPAIVYVPGIHGDWTPLWRIRHVLGRQCRLIEIAYPRTAESWSLDEYVARLSAVIDRLDLSAVHLLAESFGSLVGWAYSCRHPERVSSLMVAGGFSSSPGWFKVAAADLALRLLPPRLLDKAVDFYLIYLIKRGFPKNAFHRQVEFFPATRTPSGWRSTHNRLKIIRTTDLRSRLCELSIPILYFGGACDRLVPVRREIATLKRHLRPECVFRSMIFPNAPHPIIPARYPQVAELIFDWISKH